MPVEYSVMTVTHVDAFSISSADFYAALDHYPRAWEEIQTIIMQEHGTKHFNTQENSSDEEQEEG